MLDTPEGAIFESSAICRHLARGSPALYPRDAAARAQVDGWIDWAVELDTVTQAWVYPILGFKAYREELYAAGPPALRELLGGLERHLAAHTFLVGEGITLADLVVHNHLVQLYVTVLDAAFLAGFPAVGRWMRTLNAHPKLEAVYGPVALPPRPYAYDPAAARPWGALPSPHGLLKGTGGPVEWSGERVRATFVDFFRTKGHVFFPSSAVVPHDDPTLLFANAGMNQYKPIFMGTADPNGPLHSLKRATNSQKCIRAGGKHNDLDDVGKDTYHHTFFEMLGNWSFGDYFKREAIHWAMELLLDVYGLDKERLYATYFGGDPAQGLPPDEEAKAIWLEILPAGRVMPFDCVDNFWEMGDVGPCGPCTEIHYDRVGGRDAAALVNMDDPEVIEIWNNVFIQFNREKDRSLRPLPAKHVDTGMGFERIASILQDKMSNYDTDIFTPIFDEIQRITGAAPYTGKLGPADAGEKDMAYRVVADHIRTLSVAIADGAQPGNEGRDYVLRRVLRRGVRYGREKLGGKEGFFARLVPVVCEALKFFPEVAANRDKITAIIADEEKSFGRTLNKGIERFEKLAAASQTKRITGEEAFQLYDTFGFPVDLTELMAEEKGLTVDKAGFARAMEEAKEKSRLGGKKDAGLKLEMKAEQTATLQKMGVPLTDDAPKYGTSDVVATVAALVAFKGSEQVFVDSTAEAAGPAGAPVGAVLDATSFYAEQGGQVPDLGVLEGPSGSLEVADVQVAAGFVLHSGQVAAGALKVGDRVTCKVDYVGRKKIVANHTCTHLLNLALRDVVGPKCDQKGALYDADKLRFDFANAKPVKAQQLGECEARVRDIIQRDMVVDAAVVPLQEAMKINGVRAVFGEKYPDPVRVVSVGKTVAALMAQPDAKENAELSIEFCGGVHVPTTQAAEAFALLSEEATAKGIRRITAVTGAAAKKAIAAGEALLAQAHAAGKLADDALAKEVAKMKAVVAEAVIPAAQKAAINDVLAKLGKKLLEAAKKAQAANKEKAIGLLEEAVRATTAAGGAFALLQVEVGLDAKALQKAVAAAQKVNAALPMMVVSADAGKDKVMAYAGVDKAAIGNGFDANTWVKAALTACNGKGGGKPVAAQGQGPGAGNVGKVLEAARAFAADKLQ